jgi:quercetin dioxygenase-like cupin family protein
MAETRLFATSSDGHWTDTADGNRRRLVLHTDDLMMVEFAFEKGGVGVMHSHPRVQASYAAAGLFEVTIAGEVEIVGKGGAFIVPSGVMHGVKALDAGQLIDSFTPHRADFLP